jgi:hypothetical protein
MGSSPFVRTTQLALLTEGNAVLELLYALSVAPSEARIIRRAMRKWDLGIVAMAFLATLFWVLILKPGLFYDPNGMLRGFLQYVLR